MKNIFIIAALILFASANSTSSFSAEDKMVNDNPNDPNEAAIGKAMGAMKSTCSDAKGNLTYTIVNVSTCDSGGSIRRVIFWKGQNGNGNGNNTQVPEYVGTVTLNCDNNVVSVVCNDDPPGYF